MIMSKLFETLNSEYDVKALSQFNTFEKRVYNDIKDYSVISEDHSEHASILSSDIGNYVITEPEEIADSNSLRDFIMKFGDKVMIIFNYVI